MQSPTPIPAAPPPAADPLAGLRDWHLPAPVDWWPPAPGWWLLAGLALGAVGLGWTWWWRRRRRGAAVRAALARLAVLRAELAADGDERHFTAAVSQLLRRLALTRYPRAEVAGLAGAAWLAFLDASGGGTDFSQGPGRVLAERQYRAPAAGGSQMDPLPALDAPALAALAGRWIRAQQGTTP
jgi:hypothetical protein